jgi:hypothetical protein
MAQPLLRRAGLVQPDASPRLGTSVSARSLTPTGEPDAGNPPVRFGGRGGLHPRPYPYQPTGTRRVLSWRAPLRRRRLRVADGVRWRWGRRPRGDGRRVNHPEHGGGTEGPVAASTRPPPTGTRRVLSWRAPLRRRRLRVADRVRWRWGRRPRGDGRRVNNPEDGGGTEGPVAASARPPPTGHPQGSLLEGAAPSAPVARGGRCLLEVGSPTPRRWASREPSGTRRRDRRVPSRPQRGHLQRAPAGFSPGGRRSVGAGSAWRTVSVGGGVADPAEMGVA